MADLSKIKLNGKTYNIKDAIARGQIVQLTAAEYDAIPAATKNTDGKLYLVEDEAYTYPIDSTPTANSDHLVSSGGVKAAIDESNAAINKNTSDIASLNNGLKNLQWKGMPGYGAYRVGINFVDIHMARTSEITVNAFSRVQIATISGVVIDFNKIAGVVLARSGNNAFPLGVELTNSGVLSLYNTSSSNVTLSEIVGDIRLPIHS